MVQRRIVITDNSKDFVDLLTRFFSKQPDVEIVGVAHDGKQTLQVIERTKPDVLLLDIIMPHKDGLEVLREIKEKRMHVRVIVISAVENEAVNEAALKLGAQRCFVKPVNLTEILDVIRKEAS